MGTGRPLLILRGRLLPRLFDLALNLLVLMRLLLPELGDVGPGLLRDLPCGCLLEFVSLLLLRHLWGGRRNDETNCASFLYHVFSGGKLG